MILDVHGHLPGTRIKRRTARHRPAREHPVHLEPHVVVQPPRAVALHHEPADVPIAAGAARLGGAGEIALSAILLEPLPRLPGHGEGVPPEHRDHASGGGERDLRLRSR
jgi:hypothetical protein